MAGAQSDWPVYGHDPGGLQYSPLKQIDTKNVTKLQIAWTYDTRPPAVPASEGVAAKPAPRNRASQATPLMVGGVLYLSTPYNRVIAMEPETGKKIWEYESEYTPSGRGITYWARRRGVAAADRGGHDERLAVHAECQDGQIDDQFRRQRKGQSEDRGRG